MIACSDAVRRMWDYVEQRMDPVDRVSFEQHLELCRRCCGELEFVEELQRFMRRKPDVAVPPGVLARFEAVIDDLQATEGAT